MKANRLRLVPVFFKNTFPINQKALSISDFINVTTETRSFGEFDAWVPDHKEDKLTVIEDEDTSYLRFNQIVETIARRWYDNFANDHLAQGDEKRITITNTHAELKVLRLNLSRDTFIILSNEKYGVVMTFYLYDIF